MSKRLDQISGAIQKLTEMVIIVIFSVLIVSCILQVFTRYVLNNSLSWTEELSRFCFIWVNILGATVCLRNNSHARVTALTDLLPVKVQKFLGYFSKIIVVIVACVMMIEGIRVIQAVSSQISPALMWPMPIIYSSVPIGGFVILLDTILLGLRRRYFK